MNKVSPKSLLHSKWTKMDVINKEKHFTIISIDFDEEQRVTECIIQAVINKNEYAISWRDLKNSDTWRIGWK